MDQLRNFGDQRQLGSCIHCGDTTESRDHIPSRIFLDEPFPPNLPVVPSCLRCNNSFSLDEEYLACLVECSLINSVRTADLCRAKIKRTLLKKPALLNKLVQARRITLTGSAFEFAHDRLRNVALKLARGHAAFELNEPMRSDPCLVHLFLLNCSSWGVRETFESIPQSVLWPEVGSRAMQRQARYGELPWIMVQPGRYRYLTAITDGVIVRIVLSEYLACEVRWLD